jgi:hypothetical protein
MGQRPHGYRGQWLRGRTEHCLNSRTRQSALPSVPSDQQQALYRPAFAHNCLLLIARAHQALEGQSLQGAAEPDTAGLLARGAKELAETEEA